MENQNKYSREISNAGDYLWTNGKPKLQHLDIELTSMKTLHLSRGINRLV